MIDLNPKSIEPGKYALLRDPDGHSPGFSSPCRCVAASASPGLFDAVVLAGEAPFDGSTAMRTRVHFGRVRATCDSVAEVNVLMDSARTAQAILRNTLESIANMHNELNGQSYPDADDQLRASTLLNNSGDSTITWESDSDEVMRELIEKKLAQGVAFFVIPPKALGFIPRPKSRVTDVAEIMKHRSVSVKDEDFAAIIAQGIAGIAPRPQIDTEKAEQCHDAAVIARSQTVAVMPMRGG